MHQMNLHYPSLILVPDTFFSPEDTSVATAGRRVTGSSLLMECIQDEFEGVAIEPIRRKYWNENTGMNHSLGLFNQSNFHKVFNSSLSYRLMTKKGQLR
jgi:hypothetical protein